MAPPAWSTTSTPKQSTPNPTRSDTAHAPNPPLRHLTTQGTLMQGEHEHHITQGLCLYCRGEGHKATECSKARKARDQQGRAAVVAEEHSVPVAEPVTSGNSVTSPAVVPEN